MAGNFHIFQKRVAAPDLNINARALSGGFSSDPIDVSGFNQLTLFLTLTWTAASDVTFFVESSNDGGSTWHRLQVQTDVSSAGVVTLKDGQFKKAVTATTRWRVNMPLNDQFIRLGTVAATGATSDTLTVEAKLGAFT